MHKFIDHTGQKFGRLTVIKRAGNDKHGNAMWLCLCDCGASHTVLGGSLRNGLCRSCGCLQPQVVAQYNTKHGHARKGKHSPEFRAWNAAQQRATNPNRTGFKDYGGRGIKFLFTSFEQWFAELGPKPEPHPIEGPYSVDRIDVNGNYEPGNVQWATAREQQRNKRLFTIGKKAA
jgi:hypothetical protein